MAQSLDLPPPTHYQLFCLAVGRMFLMWARLEGSLAAALRVHLEARMPHDDEAEKNRAVRIAAAIYGSMRFKASRETIKRIATQEGFEADAMAFLAAVTEHLGNVEKIRDVIAHQSMLDDLSDSDVWYFSTALTTRAFTEA